jgi:hypothetical protein
MQPYDRTRFSDLITETDNTNGHVISWSTVTSVRQVLTVQNGNVVGNRKDPNPFSFQKYYGEGFRKNTLVRGVLFGMPSTQTTTGVEFTGNVSMTPTISADFGRTQDRALEKVYDQIRGNSNLVVDFAESAATLRMLRGTLNMRGLMSSFFNELVVPRGRSGQRRLDYITGRCLEYRYGWMPLVNSVYDAMDNLSRQVTQLEPTIKGRSSALERRVVRSGSGSYSDPSVRSDIELKYRTEYGIQFRLPPGLQIYDWTSLNPLAIAWELTPLSFVADWFVNVSQQLSLLENYWLFHSLFKKGYRTNGLKETNNTVRTGLTRNPYRYNPNGSMQDGTYEQIHSSGYRSILSRKERVVLNSLPLPSGLRLNVKVGANRQLDAAALLHQLVARRFR